METTFTYDRQVSGKTFVGRLSERECLKNSLRAGENVALYDIPKTGKASLLRQSLLELSIEGFKYTTVEISLLSLRSTDEFLNKVYEALISAVTHTQEEKDRLRNEFLHELTPEAVFELPVELARITGSHIIVLLFEFQNLLKVKDGDIFLKAYEKHVSAPQCSWIWVGSQVNGMKLIFEKHKFFYRDVRIIRLSTIPYKEAEKYILKGFLTNGKVIENELLAHIYDILKGNIYYLNHFAAICDALSRGFITDAVAQESLLSLLSIHEPRFMSMLYDLTDFQIDLLHAVIDGHTKFSAAEVIQSYHLNSSANVKRLKEALCKKEIISFDDNDTAYILDPLFEYWLRKNYFHA